MNEEINNKNPTRDSEQSDRRIRIYLLYPIMFCLYFLFLFIFIVYSSTFDNIPDFLFFLFMVIIGGIIITYELGEFWKEIKHNTTDSESYMNYKERSQ